MPRPTGSDRDRVQNRIGKQSLSLSGSGDQSVSREMKAARILKFARMLNDSLTVLYNSFTSDMNNILNLNADFSTEKKESMKSMLRRYPDFNISKGNILIATHELERALDAVDSVPHDCRSSVKRMAEIGAKSLNTNEIYEHIDRYCQQIDNMKTKDDAQSLKNNIIQLRGKLQREHDNSSPYGVRTS